MKSDRKIVFVILLLLISSLGVVTQVTAYWAFYESCPYTSNSSNMSLQGGIFMGVVYPSGESDPRAKLTSVNGLFWSFNNVWFPGYTSYIKLTFRIYVGGSGSSTKTYTVFSGTQPTPYNHFGTFSQSYINLIAYGTGTVELEVKMTAKYTFIFTRIVTLTARWTVPPP